MTYSHNRIAANRNNAERYANGSSPPNGSSSSFFGHAGMHSSRKTNQNRGVWQRSHANQMGATRCVGNGNNQILSPQPINTSSSSISSSPVTTANMMNRSGGRHSSGNKSNNHQRTNGVQALNGGGPISSGAANSVAAGLFGRVSPTISSLPTITHFAGSKCFDAPAPTALPKPPQHWTLTSGGPIAGLAAVTVAAAVASTAGCRPAAGRRSQVPSQTSHHSAFKTARRTLFDDFGTHNLKLLLNVQS